MFKYRPVLGIAVLSLSMLGFILVFFYKEGEKLIVPVTSQPTRLCEVCYPVQRNNSLDHGELIPDMNYISSDDISRDVLGKSFKNIASTLDDINNDTHKLDQTSLRKRLMDSKVDYEKYTYIPGGHWKPKGGMTDSSKVAVLIPFRNRERTLGIFLRHMVPFILRQRLEFGFFVIEQTDSLKFNRAMLMNVGFLEALEFEDWDCIIIHDVDFIPHYDDNPYTCSNMPRHFLSGVAKRPKVFDFEFNGVTGFTVKQFQLMNGAPNRYWGWGGEDHDIRTRAELMNFKIVRTKYPYGFYDHIPHTKHKQNETENNWNKFNKEVHSYQFRDGLNNLRYSQPEVTIHPLFVKIAVALSKLKVQP